MTKFALHTMYAHASIHTKSEVYFGVYFLLWNVKEDILKTTNNQMVSVTIDFYCINQKYNGSQKEEKILG